MVSTRSKARNNSLLKVKKSSFKKPRVTFAKNLEHVINTLSRNNAAAEQKKIQRLINRNSQRQRKNARNQTYGVLFNAHGLTNLSHFFKSRPNLKRPNLNQH